MCKIIRDPGSPDSAIGRSSRRGREPFLKRVSGAAFPFVGEHHRLGVLLFGSEIRPRSWRRSIASKSEAFHARDWPWSSKEFSHGSARIGRRCVRDRRLTARYSPECVEGQFCELRVDGVLSGSPCTCVIGSADTGCSRGIASTHGFEAFTPSLPPGLSSRAACPGFL